MFGPPEASGDPATPTGTAPARYPVAVPAKKTSTPASALDRTRAVLAAAAELSRPDAWHLEEARHRLRTGRGYRPPPGALASPLARLAAAWDARALADADAVWDALLLPAERLGQADARRVVARADVAQAAALCLGPARPPRVAFRDWFQRNGRVAPGGWTRSWSGRRGA